MNNDTRIDFRQDITAYSDQELSLQVFNDEYYYSERDNREYLLALVSEQFKFTAAQMDKLLTDLLKDEADL